MRNSVLLLGFLAVPGFSGCMSAIDDTSAFGFSSPTTPPETIAVAGAAGAVAGQADGAAPGEAGAGAGKPAAAAQVAASGAENQPAQAIEAGTAELAAAEKQEKALLTQASSTYTAPRAEGALAAYSPPGQSARQADRSLFAALTQKAEDEQPEPQAVAESVAARIVVTHTDGMGKPSPSAELPGVDAASLFKIGKRASVDSEEFLDDIGGEYQIASLGGMARLAPSGLMVAREDVNTSCFGTDLVRLLRQVEARFGKKVVVTSGFRSPPHNRRVGGAKASMHMACKAADFHIPGVSGVEVARYVRALPNRGGVGTYCHTAAIHVDVGRQRDWNWPCRRRS